MLYGALIGAAVGALIYIVNGIIKKKYGNEEENVKDLGKNEKDV